jgi:hypothetical protein
MLVFLGQLQHFLKNELIQIENILTKYTNKLQTNGLFLNNSTWLGMNINGFN